MTSTSLQTRVREGLIHATSATRTPHRASFLWALCVLLWASFAVGAASRRSDGVFTRESVVERSRFLNSRRLQAAFDRPYVYGTPVRPATPVYALPQVVPVRGKTQPVNTAPTTKREESPRGLEFLEAVGKGLRRKIGFHQDEFLSELNRDPRQDLGIVSFQTGTNFAYQYGEDVVNVVKTDGFQHQLGTQASSTLTPSESFQEGFEQGLGQGLAQGIQRGFEAGFDAGFNQGFQSGFDQGLRQGILLPAALQQAPPEGSDALFQQGYSEGFQASHTPPRILACRGPSRRASMRGFARG